MAQNSKYLRKRIMYNGVPYTYEQIAEKHGVTPDAINLRKISGWTDEEIFVTPRYYRKRVKYGAMKKLKEEKDNVILKAMTMKWR